jgi:leader peptidase (prepilin peptidase)/N-methyltransferase
MAILHYLQENPLLFIICMGLLGLLVGSFLNVVILRLPIMMQNEWHRDCCELLDIKNTREDNTPFNIIVPRSHCPSCGHKISAFENIPVLSYILLSGKCKDCKCSIPVRYPLIESFSGLLTVFIAWHYGYGMQAVMAIILTWSLLCLSVIDIDHKLLPDDITLPVMWLGILVNLFGVFTDIHSSIIGAMAGYAILWIVFMGFKILTGKEGMGYGDFKLLAMLGAWMGWQHLPTIIFLSSICGAVIGIGLIVFRNHDRSNPIPFGPYLAMAGWIALLWGDKISLMYRQWAFAA